MGGVSTRGPAKSQPREPISSERVAPSFRAGLGGVRNRVRAIVDSSNGRGAAGSVGHLAGDEHGGVGYSGSSGAAGRAGRDGRRRRRSDPVSSVGSGEKERE